MFDLLLTNNSVLVVLISLIFVVLFVSLYVLRHLSPYPKKLPSSPLPGVLPHKAVKNMTVILNPVSGSGKAVKIYNKEVEPILKGAGIHISKVETTDKGHAHRIATQIPQQECDAIICVGGDGLVHEIVNGLLNRSDATIARHIPIGIIPCGTTNGLANSLGIYTPHDAVLKVIEGRIRPLDILGLFPISSQTSQPSAHAGLYAVHSIKWGLSSEVDSLAEKIHWLGRLKRPLAVMISLASSFSIPTYTTTLSFLPAALSSILTQTPCNNNNGALASPCPVCEHPMPSVKGKKPNTDMKDWVVVDGTSDNLSFIVAGNTPSVFTPNAHLSDGYVDIAVVERCSRLDLARLLLLSTTSKLSRLPSSSPLQQHVRYHKTSHFRFDVDRDIPLTVDGELVEPPEYYSNPEPFRAQVEVNRGLCLIIC